MVRVQHEGMLIAYCVLCLKVDRDQGDDKYAVFFGGVKFHYSRLLSGLRKVVNPAFFRGLLG